MKITRDGLRLLARLVVSCEPLGMKTPNHELFIAEKTREERDIDTTEFERVFPNIVMYGQLREEATALGRSDIDAEVICRFFGGIGHVEKVQDDIANHAPFLEENAKLRIALMHMLLPVTLTEMRDGLFGAEYRNNGTVIRIYPLHIFKSDTSTENLIGTRALTHFSSIILLSPPEALATDLLRQQYESDILKRSLVTLHGGRVQQNILCTQVQKLIAQYGL